MKIAKVSERMLKLTIVLSLPSGAIVGWQADRLRRKFLDWRKEQLQSKLGETQKKLGLA
ncbi:mitoregulin-like [Heptranchias perlo]|uniref:mitoregulin-like n=1 Tax=Heptranchias perlo TaxID=212740 RepID=UPI0035595B3E